MTTPNHTLAHDCADCIAGWSAQSWFRQISQSVTDYHELIIRMKVPGLSSRLRSHLKSLNEDDRRDLISEINDLCRQAETAYLVTEARTTVCQRIAEQITDAREAQDLTITQLADMAGIPRSQLSRIESVKYTQPACTTIAAIAAALRIKITI